MVQPIQCHPQFEAVLKAQYGTVKIEHPNSSQLPEMQINPADLNDLKPWLTQVEGTAQAAVSDPVKSSFNLVLVNLNIDRSGGTSNSPRPLNSLLAHLEIPISVVCFEEAFVWKFYPPTRDMHDRSSTSKPRTLLRSVSNYHFGIAWKYYPRALSTVGVAWFTNHAPKSCARMLSSFTRWARLSFHPLLPAVLFLREYVICERTRVGMKKADLKKTMKSSGFHDWVNLNRGTPQDDVDWDSISSHVIGYTTALASRQSTLLGMSHLATAILEQNTTITFDHPNLLTQANEARLFLDEEAKHSLRESHEILRDTQVWQQNATNILQGTFNAISRRDQKLNLEAARDAKRIAEQSSKLAYESFILAQESKKDSTSMSTIATVTMFFLPGAFVASFLDTPIFDIDSTTNRLITRQMWVYWVVTLPLTVVTVAAWLWWNRVSLRAQQENRKNSQISYDMWSRPGA